jgi:hypothetical protein
MQHKIAQLSLTPGRNAKNTSEVYVAQPDASKEMLAGKLFMVIEAPKKGTGGLKLVNFLIDNLNFNYYQNEKIMLREKLPSLKIDHIFEMALTKTNKNFAAFLEKEEIDIPIESINITAGVVYEGKINFAVSGKNKVFLIHKKKDGKNADEEYKLSDLAQPTDKGRKTKLFTDVMSGIIPPGGSFLFTNEAVPEYISAKQLTGIVSTLPPAGAVEQIKNNLADINSYISFMAVVIKGPTDTKDDLRPVSTRDSILDLNRTEENTENLLMPSGVINLKKWIKAPAAAKDLITDNAPAAVKGGLAIKDNIFVKRKSFLLLGRVAAAFKYIGAIAANILFFLAKTLSERRKISGLFKGLFAKIPSSAKTMGRFITNLSPKRKLLLGLAGIFVLLFFSSTFLTRSGQNKEVGNRQYEEMVSVIKKMQDQAEAHMLYSNQDGASRLFDEISAKLGELPKETDEQKETYREIEEKFNAQLEKMRKVEKVEVETIADFKNLIGQANPANLSLALGTKKIYAGDSENDSVYILDTDSNLVTTAAAIEEDMDSFSLSAASANYIYYLNKDMVIGFDLAKEEFTRISIGNVGEFEGFRAADVYNERLYLMHEGKNQIYRFTRSGKSFTAPYAWVGNPMDFTGAVDISIDGNIYVLSSNGELTKLLHGNKQDFKLDQVEPKIEQAAKLFVSTETDHIYVLEPKNQRLIVYNKKGQFLLQYADHAFNDLKDFAIDDQNKLVYLLNGSTVLKFKASHYDRQPNI